VLGSVVTEIGVNVPPFSEISVSTFITPTKPIPEGNVTVRATDDAEVPNSSTSDPVMLNY
jgi:hypothetical protein